MDIEINEALKKFYEKNGFGSFIGKRPCTVKVYTGCMLVPLPNIEVRNKYLKYHDLHHLITGYSVGRIGEGEVSAWELGTGSFYINIFLGIMNLIALSTGLILNKNRMWQAFLRGKFSRNIYAVSDRNDIENGKWKTLNEIKSYSLHSITTKNNVMMCWIEFIIYGVLSLIIHFMIVIPAIILRVITDIMMGKRIFEVIKPKKRSDLY